MALRYVWQKYGRANHVVSLLRFLWFLFLFASSCVTWGLLGNGFYKTPQFWVIGYSLNIIVFSLNLSYIKDEFRQGKHVENTKYHSKRISRIWWIHHILSDIWNIIDFVAFMAIFWGTLMRAILIIDTNFSRVMMSIATVLMSFKLVYFFRAFESTGRLISYMIRIIKGIGYFLLVLGILVIGFAVAFWILANKPDGIKSDSGFSEIDSALITTIAYMMGQYSEEDFTDMSVDQFAKTLYVLQIIVTSIVMLNLLIAMMGDIYQSADKTARKFLNIYIYIYIFIL